MGQTDKDWAGLENSLIHITRLPGRKKWVPEPTENVLCLIFFSSESE